MAVRYDLLPAMSETRAKRLTRLRKAKGWSQQELANAAGISQGTIGNVEADIRGYGKSVLGVAKALGVTPDYLECKTDDPGQAVKVEPHGYSVEALALAWLLDQVPNRLDKVQANAAATAAILRFVHQRGAEPTHTPSESEIPAKPRA